MTDTFDFSTLETGELGEGIDENPRASDFEPSEEYDRPDLSGLDKPKPSRVQQEYTAKTQLALNNLMATLADDPRTVADAAIIILKGRQVALAAGEVAAESKRAAKVIDFFTDTTDNPYGKLAQAAAPIVLQCIRNHEPVLEPQTRGIPIPFTKKRLNLKFGIKLGRIRALTREPSAVESWVFDDPEVMAKLEKAGISVKRSGRRR